MRSFTASPLLLLLLPSLATSHVIQPESRPTSTPTATVIIQQATPASSVPRIAKQLPAQTAHSSGYEKLDLRQAVDPAVKVVDPAAKPVNPVAAPVVPVQPGAPAVTTTSTASTTSSALLTSILTVSSTSISTSSSSVAPVAPAAPPVANPVVNPNPAPLPTVTEKVGSELVTVQWLETHITMPSTTSTTWVPVTVTIKFAAVPEQAAEPGVGHIGLGTITKTAEHGAGATMGPVGGRLGVLGVVGGVFGLGMMGFGG